MDGQRAVVDPVPMTAAAAPTTVQRRPTWLRYPISGQLWRDAGYLVVTLVMSIVSYAALVAGLSASLSLAPFVVGVPVALGAFMVYRGLAELERRRAALVLGARIPGAYRRPEQAGLMARIKTTFRDPQSWRDLLWTAFDGTIGFGFGVLAVTVWGVVIGSLVLPAWWWSLPDGGADLYGLFAIHSTGQAFIGTAIGVALIVPAAWLTRGLALGHANVARALLRPGSGARVEQLTESRAGAVDAAHEELQRIERDLHDGAQARLVALAMDLGMAERKIGDDPEAGRELIGEAREQALHALGELRELVRGIGPSILRDRGLEAAIASLAVGRSQPVDIDVDVGDPRPTATVEAAAYFVVAESLANAAKHSQASRVSVRVWRDAAALVVECADDGRGGADAAAGSGLSGLAKRVAALDGQLIVTSPPGGPTRVRAEIPCE
jgi:signal transduction histidine kinase